MKKIYALACVVLFHTSMMAQSVMTPELLWKIGRVGFVAQHPKGHAFLYKVAHYDVSKESASSTYYIYDLKSHTKAPTNMMAGYQFIQWDDNGIYARKDNALHVSKDEGKTWIRLYDRLDGAMDIRISANGKWLAYSKKVQANLTLGKDIYPDMPKNSAKIYTDLDYRHWDTWNDGKVNHVFIVNISIPNATPIDLLEGTAYNTPQQPFGGAEDFVFSPDSKTITYVCKKKVGKAYAESTNTDLYEYNLQTGRLTNLSQGMMGYDVHPLYNADGSYIAWLSMARDGYEADKNDLIVMNMKTGVRRNLTADFDMTIDGTFAWSQDGTTLFYTATTQATSQLFYTSILQQEAPRTWKQAQMTKGQHDVTGIYGETNTGVIVSRTDMNHASELFLVDKKSGQMKPLSSANDHIYNNIQLSKVEMHEVQTTHGHDMGVWIIYPPNFDKNKKYPTLLYCQGGPQGAVSQFYSFRWNFQLMAAQGYIVVAPNRTGLPGYGVKWNEDISGDWGGQPMKDYLSAIDYAATLPYVDADRLGAVGASYGGYSVFMLAGIHENRFKSFISHCGLFDMKSWYGTTEELWFANWDLKGNYWQQPQPKSYTAFNPSNYVSKWNTPILIFQGEMDFRVPIEQGLQAFQAAQLQGLKSKLVLFPDENHWILKPQNAMVWHREFFNWLSETL